MFTTRITSTYFSHTVYVVILIATGCHRGQKYKGVEKVPEAYIDWGLVTIMAQT